MLAAMTPNDDVRVLDLRCEGWPTDDWTPDIVGVSCLTPELHEALRVLAEARRRWPEAFTVPGGHCLANPARIRLAARSRGEEARDHD